MSCKLTFVQIKPSNSPFKRGMVKKVILCSVLLFPVSNYIYTLSITSGCVHEVYKVTDYCWGWGEFF